MKIKKEDGQLNVPDQVDIPFIEGDGTGPDIWHAARLVFDKAVDKAYGSDRSIAWIEVLAGEKSSTRPAHGFQKKPSMLFESMWWPSRGRSRPPWGRASAA